jgi:glycosyltransferase involved in cell wall biosynthesis
MLEAARIAVVVPAYREERLIGRALASIPRWVDAIFPVDDASPDGTWQKIGDFAGLHPSRVKPLRHHTNQGVGAAIVSGYRAAIADGADVIAVMAGDAQMDPADLRAVVGPVARGRADYAKGNRFLHPERRQMPLVRRAGGALLSALTRATTGLSIGDTQCGYTAISPRALQALPLERLWPRYGYPNDLLGMLAAQGFHVIDVPVRPVYADEQSGIRAWHLFSVSAVILRRWLTSRLSRGSRARRANRRNAAHARDRSSAGALRRSDGG